VIVGVDTRDTVADVIGSPSSSGVLRDSGYYYVSQQVRTFAYQAPEVIDRQVVAVTFDADGVVQNIERFALEDGNVVALSRRVTDSNVQGLSFLRQLLGNIGSFGSPGGIGNNDL
jgi:outer membrane protein assembly factor BamE (lipoprotein component of BamABCDE complex)